MNWKTIIGGFVFTLISAGSAQAQSGASDNVSNARAPQNDWITLRLNWRAGDTFRITDRSHTKSVAVTPETQDNSSSKVETITDMTQVSEYRVLYLHADGAAQVRVSYLDTKERVSVDGKPQNEGSLKSLWPNVQVEMKIAPDGRISDVRGGDKIWRAVIGIGSVETFSDFTPEQRREMEQMLKETFGEDSIKLLFEQAGMSFPPNPVRVGQPWSQRVQTKGLLPLTMNLKRSVTGRANGVFNILEKGTLSLGDKTKIASFNDQKMRVAMSGAFSGNTQINQSTGFTRSAFFTTRLGGTTTVYETNAKPAVTRDYILTTTRLSVQKLP